MKQEDSELLIGAHTSAAGGVQNALLEGQDIGATTIQFFTANQKRWDGKPLSTDTLSAWKTALDQTQMRQVMSHDSYLINLGAPSEENLLKSRKTFGEEILRCQALGVAYLNFHPGAAVGSDPQECMDKICESLLMYEPLVGHGSLRLLLENTAGQGSAIGHRFEELAYILNKVKHKIPIGVCIDTCHAFAAGYDIRTAEGWDETLKTFDRLIGLEHLYAFHVNDSLKGLGSRVDRHASLGKGLMGIDCFKVMMTDPRTRTLPKYLETPEGPPVWKEEIAMLREFAKSPIQKVQS